MRMASTQVLQQFLGSGKVRGALVMHDCRPRTASAALPDQAEARRRPDFSGAWSGDVYKALIRLRVELDDHRVLVLDDDQGIGLIFRGEPDDRLDLSTADISALTFEQFDADKTRLLNLHSPVAFKGVLAAVASNRS